MAVRTGTKSYNGYYIEGNTVKLAEPAYLPQKEKRRRRIVISEKKERTVSIPTIVLFTAIMLGTLLVSKMYLQVNAEVNAYKESVARLEEELLKVRTENDDFEQNIDTSVDLNKIRDVAINELGMVYAGQNSIVTYEKTESEYVRQNEKIS